MAAPPPRDPYTLTRWILKKQQKYKNAKGDLSILLNSIQLACKIISNAAKKAGIYALYGLSGGQNSTGDQVKKLDVFSNDCMINSISFCGKVPCMASEEMEMPIIVKDCEEPKYVVSFDPLDGSSNIDANVSVGTIFAIHRVDDPKAPEKSLLNKGRDMVCAGYAMYGDATVLVISFGDEVNGFTLDPSIGEFIMTHENIRIPPKGKYYSINEGNAMAFDKAVTEYVAKCKTPDHGKPKKARYIGSMVADVHRTLLYGGIFMYPASKDNPKGKLRVLYELNPMAFIVEAAGGKAIDGKKNILDIQPTSIHCKSPVYLGSTQDIDELLTLKKKYANDDESKVDT